MNTDRKRLVGRLREVVHELAMFADTRDAACAVVSLLLWQSLENQVSEGRDDLKFPPETHLAVVRVKQDSELLSSLLDASKQLEKANPRLRSVFSAGKLLHVFSLDHSRRDSALSAALRRILYTVNTIVEESQAPEDAAILVEALLQDLATGRSVFGVELTPVSVARCMAELVSAKPHESIYDPVCGTGGLLVAATECVEGSRLRRALAPTVGQERQQKLWGLATLQLLARGIDAQVDLSDCLNHVLTGQDGQQARFDVVLSNPPFSFPWTWNDRLSPPIEGAPPRTADFAFILHAVASMNERGRGALIMPRGVLFRGAAEKKIRQHLLRRDVLEAVIGLPSHLFHGTSIAPCVLLFNRSKIAGRKDHVIFVDATGNPYSGKTRPIPEQLTREISGAVHSWSEKAGFSKIVSRQEIEAADVDMTPTRYISAEEKSAVPSLDDAISAFEQAIKLRDEAESQLRHALHKHSGKF